MELTLNDIDLDDELDLEGSQQSSEEDLDEKDKPWMDSGSSYTQEDQQDTNIDYEDEEDDLLTSVLKSKGIDPKSVKVTNDEGEIEEIDFNDLTKEEQLGLLNYNPYEQDYDLDDEEIGFLSNIRNNNLSVSEYLNYIKRQAIQEYIDSQDDMQIYDIDSYSDDQLFMADLKDKIPDLTEEEALQQLEVEKQNADLFARKINGIREAYKNREKQIAEQEQQAEAERRAKEAAEFEDLIVKTIQENDSIDFGDSVLSMSENDMNDIASFILDSDAAGVRHLAKALNDPKTLVEMAWYAIKGRDALAQVSDYYKKKITEAANANYQKGYSDGKSGKQASKTVVKPSQKRGKPQTFTSINDLD